MIELLFVNLLPAILFLDGLGGDMILVLKIFTLMAIISYVLQHLGKGPLAILIILVMCWFIIFDYFALFGGIYVLYVLLGMGLTGVIIDFFFVTPMPGQQGAEGPSGDPISNGKDFMERQAHYQALLGRGGRR